VIHTGSAGTLVPSDPTGSAGTLVPNDHTGSAGTLVASDHTRSAGTLVPNDHTGSAGTLVASGSHWVSRYPGKAEMVLSMICFHNVNPTQSYSFISYGLCRTAAKRKLFWDPINMIRGEEDIWAPDCGAMP